MVHTYSGDSKNSTVKSDRLANLAITSWHFRTDLLPDESLSSWLIRAGLTHAIEPLSLGRIIWGDWRVWTRDIDRWLSTQRLEVLSQAIGIPRDKLYLVTLTPWVRQMSMQPLNPMQRWYWVSSISHRNRSRHFSFSFCPLCLAEDEIPYMRKSWRYSWVISCAKHKILLHEGCPHCDFSVHLSRHTLQQSNLRYCTSCHGDLSAVTNPQPAEKSVYEPQIKMANALYSGQPVAQDFAVLKFLIQLVRKSLVLKRPAQKSPLNEFINISPEKRNPLCSIPFTELSIADRYALLNAAFSLQNLEESDFINLLLQSGVTRSFFLKDTATLPETIIRASYHLPYNKHERIKSSRASKCWPNPRSAKATQRLLKLIYKSVRLDAK